MKNFFDFKSFINFLGKNKAYTAIDIFGLSVSFMFVILISVYTVKELSVDKDLKNYDNLYILASESNFGSAYRIADHLKNRYPEIDEVCPMTSHFIWMPVVVNDNKQNAGLLMVESNFFDLFSYELVEGSRDGILSDKNSAVISESFARKVFQDVNPIGQTITVADSLSVVVNGIMKDLKNSIFRTNDIVFRIDHVGKFNQGMDSEQFNNAGSALIFVKTDKIDALNAKTDDIVSYFKEIFWLYRDNLRKEVKFVPMADVYFSDLSSNGLLNQGDWSFVMVLMSIGLLILLFAIINYINLTVAQTGFRAKEMATRRLLGSSRGELFARLIVESTMLSLVSFVLGFVLAYILAPYAEDLLQTKLDMSYFFNPWGILIAFVVVVVLGVAAGVLPASIISNSKPIEVVRGSFKAKSKMVFSRVFIVFQDVITIVLVAASITMVWQINYMQNAPLGYSTKNILDISTGNFESKEQLLAYVNEVKKVTGVNRVALSQGTPFNMGNNWTTKYPHGSVGFQILGGDSVFLEMMGFEILRENNVASGNACYLSEQALRETELKEDAESFTLGTESIPVAGVIKDIQMGNITYSKKPIIYKFFKNDNYYPWDILVETSGNHYKVREDVEKLFKEITKLDPFCSYIDEQIEKSFTDQRRMSKIVMVFSVVAVLISLLGLLAMSTYFIQQRASEIAVRKVFGSTNKEVLNRLVWTFLTYVLIAFVISVPIIWYFMSRWLSDYSYRIDLSPVIFLAAGVFCFVISFVTVFVQSYNAATTNPVESFKSK